MFKLDDKVFIVPENAPYLDCSELRDKIGVITHINTRIFTGNNDPVTHYRVTFDTGTVTVFDDCALRYEHAQAQPLTLREMQQLKDQLALDLLALITTYEKVTNTHIAEIHPITHTYFGDGTKIKRITGIRLEVIL